MRTAYVIHELAEVKSVHVGPGTNIWQFCVVLQNAEIGDNCNICSHCFIENDVVIGNNVTIKNGVHIWDGVSIEDDVFVGPNVTFSNDLWPKSKQRPESFDRTVVRKQASIGANATILPGVTIGQGAVVGAGAVVTRSVPPYAVVVGNPARIIRYAKTDEATPAPLAVPSPIENRPARQAVSVDGVSIHYLPVFRDIRGEIAVGEFERSIPFSPLRYFIVYGVPSKETRGEHAHRQCHQFLICIRGSCAIVADDAKRRIEIPLDSPDKGVHLPPMTWGIQYKYSSDAMLLVFASHYYDPADYIRDYSDFVRIRSQAASSK